MGCRAVSTPLGNPWLYTAQRKGEPQALGDYEGRRADSAAVLGLASPVCVRRRGDQAGVLVVRGVG